MESALSQSDHDQHLFFQSSRVRVTRARAINTLHTYGVTEDGRQLHSVSGSCHSQLFISMNLTQVSWAVALGQISFMIDRSRPRLSLFEKSEIAREKKFWKLKPQSTPDNSNLQRKSKKVLVIGSSKQITGSKDISKWMGRKGN